MNSLVYDRVIVSMAWLHSLSVDRPNRNRTLFSGGSGLAGMANSLRIPNLGYTCDPHLFSRPRIPASDPRFRATGPDFYRNVVVAEKAAAFGKTPMYPVLPQKS